MMRRALANGYGNSLYRFYGLYRPICQGRVIGKAGFAQYPPEISNLRFGSRALPIKPIKPDNPMFAVPREPRILPNMDSKGTLLLPMAVFRVAPQNIFPDARQLFAESAFIHECLHDFVLQTVQQEITLVNLTDHDICAGPV